MKILHVGATGLVGQLVLARLLESPGVARVVEPTRRPLALRHHALENPGVDFDALPAEAPWWAVDAARCTMGTTLADAGSQSGRGSGRERGGQDVEGRGVGETVKKKKDRARGGMEKGGENGTKKNER